MKTLFTNHCVNKNFAIHEEFISYKSTNDCNREFKFRIRVNIENGDPLGFNTNCCLMVMTSDGKFEYVVDNRSIGVPYSNDYYSSEEIKENIIKEAVKGFKKFIKTVY